MQALTCIQTVVLTELHCIAACPTCWGAQGTRDSGRDLIGLNVESGVSF